MERQENIRKRLIDFISENGVSQVFIANKIKNEYGEEIPLDILSRFKNGKRSIWDGQLELIEKFLVQHNA